MITSAVQLAILAVAQEDELVYLAQRQDEDGKFVHTKMLLYNNEIKEILNKEGLVLNTKYATWDRFGVRITKRVRRIDSFEIEREWEESNQERIDSWKKHCLYR